MKDVTIGDRCRVGQPQAYQWEPGTTGTATLSGRLDAVSVAQLWPFLVLPTPVAGRVTVDAGGLERCDGAGLAVILELRRQAAVAQVDLQFVNLSADIQKLLAPFKVADYAAMDMSGGSAREGWLAEKTGRMAVETWRDGKETVNYIGELAVTLAWAAVHPRRVRWHDTLVVASKAGVDALPVVLLVAFLMGLILAFQAAIPMRMFGADIFVASLVGISIVRELGPLMTAIVLTGRSGSAFAAEIGTMTVNQEIDALNTMGLEPVRFLAVPRVLAGTVVMPLLTLFANLAGLVGGLVVMLGFGFPLTSYANQVKLFVHWPDLLGGLLKAAAFGFLVAAVGCLRGLQTARGPAAVGEATTRSVVSGIVLVAVADGLFAVLFNVLKW